MLYISKKETEHIAKLARIDFSEKEIIRYQKELSAILDFVSELNKVNTDNVEPISSTVELKNILRKDVITNKPDIENLFSNAPEKEGSSFRVNKVIDKGSPS